MGKQKSMGDVLWDARIRFVKTWMDEYKTHPDAIRIMHQFMAENLISEHERRKRAKVKRGKK